MDNFIKIWKWKDAPHELRALSDHHGDEDFVMLIPPDWNEFWPDATDLEGTAFGSHMVSAQELPDGSTVLIGTHS